MMLAMVLFTLYNIVDAFWVSGLGPDALAAIGLVFPFFIIIVALANGIGVGGSAAISRHIGAKNKKGADSAATHTVIFVLIISALFTLPLYAFSDSLFAAMIKGNISIMASSYAKIIFLGTIFMLFTNMGNSILRGEGDTKRAMYIMVISSMLNIILDPIFIYHLGWGIAGAAWATVLSLVLSSLVLFYWLFIKRNTHVSFYLKGFSLEYGVIKDIMKVGLPATIQQLSMGISIFIMNIIILLVSSTDGIAIYSVGWRIVSLATMPMVGISTAVVSVIGAAYGAKKYKNIRIAHFYSIKFGLSIVLIAAITTFVFSEQITLLFIQSSSSVRIASGLSGFLKIMSFFYVMMPFGIFSSSLFQGIGKGMHALIVTTLRSIIMTPLFAWLFGVVLHEGLNGVWWGIVTGNMLGAFIAFIWAILSTKRLMEKSAQ